MQSLSWLDTGETGVEIKVAEFPGRGDGAQALLVQAPAALPPHIASGLSGLGFVPFGSDGRRMVRKGTAFLMSEMVRVFPEAFQVSVPASSIRIRFEPAKPKAESHSNAPVTPAPVTRPETLPKKSAGAPAEGNGEGPAARPTTRFGSPFRAAPVSSPSQPVAEPSIPAPASTSLPGVASSLEAPVSGPKGFGRSIVKPAPRPPRTLAPTETFTGSRVNRFQSEYRPGSKLGAPIAMIPVNLAAPTEAALQRVRDTYGDIDDFVASRLDWTIEEMEKLLSPEQIDAVALEIAAADRGQAFILADQTGLGKGRVVAAVARAAVLAGKVAVVITEKENLFSDLFRDINDIGSMEFFGRPFMVNDGAQIVDVGSVEREVIHAPWKKQDVTEVLKSGILPEGTKLVLSTYTQYNKRGSTKAEFLKKIVRDQHLICDESHNAVGDSATSENLSDAMDVAASVMYSSATFARNAKNLAAYKRLFPVSMRSSDLMGVLSAGGQAISEALSQMLAEDGVYLRREQDLSDIAITVIDDTARLARNSAYADALSPILASIAKISRGVSAIVDEKNSGGPDAQDYGGRKAARELWYTGNFGARLGVVVRQFVTALLVDLCVEDAVATLDKGEKPVVVIESTMESLMRELAADDGVEEPFSQVDGQAEMSAPDLSTEDDQVQPGRAPDFRDALRTMLDRTMMLMLRKPGQEDPDRIPVDDPELVAAADELRVLIEAFPDLPLSPIDDVRDRIEAIGRERAQAGLIDHPWVADEISARAMRVVNGEYVKLPPQDRLGSVAGFNAGKSDVLVITRAASTGLSLHSSERALDQRRRRMIELQIPSNVVERMQFFGRVNRRGQVNVPSFGTLSTGLPLQTRQLAIQNRKMADLSANVTASAESASAMDVPDMIDAVGNMVCRRLLEERPSLADRMHIPMKLQDAEKAEGELYHVNKFLQRLVLLPAREQAQVYREALNAYEDAVREMLARGQHPRGARELEGEWQVVESELFEPGDPQDGPIFGRPVMVTTIESYQTLSPWTGEQVSEAAALALSKLPKLPGAKPDDPFAGSIKAIGDMRAKVLQAAVPQRFISVRQAMSDSKPNAVKEANSRLDYLISLLRTIRPGALIEMKGEEGREEGVVIDVRPPSDPREAHYPGRWTIKYIIPGDERPREISAATIIRDPSSRISPFPKGVPPMTLRRFDNAPRGQTLVRRRLLDGNLVRAVIAARNAGWGSSATWTDTEGLPHRAILVPKNKQNSMNTLPGRCTDPDLAATLLEEGAVLFTNPDDPDSGATIVLNGNKIEIEVPGSKRIAKLFETEEILRVVGRYRGDQRAKTAELPANRLEEVCRAFAASGHAFHYKGDFRRKVTDILARQEQSGFAAPAL